MPVKEKEGYALRARKETKKEYRHRKKMERMFPKEPCFSYPWHRKP